MKTIRIGTLIIVFIAVYLGVGRGYSGAADSQGSLNVGRFQLFQGTYTALDAKNKRADKETGIFLLDTFTGKVKRYSTGLNKDGRFFERWVSTDASTPNK